MSLEKAEKSKVLGRVTLLVALAIGTLPVTARASARENKERAAKTACLAGDYAKGVALLAELFVSTNDATYLFNQGRCFEQNGKYDEAIVRFREYQQKNADAGKAPDEEADKHIAKCQGLLDKQRPAAPSLVAAPVPVPVAPTNAPAVQQNEVKPSAMQPAPAIEPRAAIVEAAAPTGSGRGLRIGGITTAAIGVAGVAAGVIFNLKANSLAKDLENANGSSTTLYSRSTESSRSTYQTLGWVAYGAGAACIAGGAVMYFIGASQGHEAQVAFVPSLGAGSVGGVLKGAF